MNAGYGVWGMDVYLKRFWVCLDWAVMWVAYAQFAFCKQVLEYEYICSSLLIVRSFECEAPYENNRIQMILDREGNRGCAKVSKTQMSYEA